MLDNEEPNVINHMAFFLR